MKTREKMILITIIVGVLLFVVQVAVTFADSIVHREWILEYEGLKTHEAQVISGQAYPAPVYPTATATKKPKKPSKNETTEPYPAPVIPTLTPIEPNQRVIDTWWIVNTNDKGMVYAYFSPQPFIFKSEMRNGAKWYRIGWEFDTKVWARPVNNIPKPPTPAPTMTNP
jgi:hypothetical protein